ncbi:hypothetical protein SEUCBS139899_007756 [Sporothrix eucalyptigena]
MDWFQGTFLPFGLNARTGATQRNAFKRSPNGSMVDAVQDPDHPGWNYLKAALLDDLSPFDP